MNPDVILALVGVAPLIAAAWRWLARGHSVRAEVKADHAERCRRLGLEDQARQAAHEARVLILRPDIIKSRQINRVLRFSRTDAWAGVLFGFAAGLSAFHDNFALVGTLTLGGVQLGIGLLAYWLVGRETDHVQSLVTAEAQKVAAKQDAEERAAEQSAPAPVGRVSAGERITRAWRELTGG